MRDAPKQEMRDDLSRFQKVCSVQKTIHAAAL